MKEIHTKRLLLRVFTMNDLEDVFDYATLDSVGPNAGWPPHKTRETTKEIIQSFIDKGEVFAIEHTQDKKVIGSIGLHQQKDRAVNSKDLGYVLHPNYCNQGITTEAALAVIQYAFTSLHLDMVTATHFSKNVISKRVIEKCGFVYEGCLRNKSKLYNGDIVDVFSYSLTKEEWKKQSK